MAGAFSRPSRCSGRSCSRALSAPCRSARPRSGPGSRRCRRLSLWSAVELRPEESRGRLQDLVRPPELFHLALEFAKPRPLVRREPRTRAAVDFGTPHPDSQRLVVDPGLFRDRLDRLPLRGVFVGMLEDQADRSLADLCRVGTWPLVVCHCSILSRGGAVTIPGAVHRSWWTDLALTGMALRTPWSLRYETDVTLAVRGSTVDGATLNSPAATITLTVRKGVFYVASVTLHDVSASGA